MGLVRMASPEEARTLKETARQLVLSGNVERACFEFAWAALSYRSLGDIAEALHCEVLLAWAQEHDGRPWQAVRTLATAMAEPEFGALPSWIQSRAHMGHAWASWWLGDMAASAEHAAQAYSLASDPLEQGRAALALAQAAQHLGQHREAEAHFRRAVELDPSLDVTAYGVRAYLLNLAGEHHKALREAEAGLDRLMHGAVQPDDSRRAAERTALLVERSTAKAFLQHRDARQATLTAHAALQDYPSSSQLEYARVNRAQAMVLIRAREHNAAEALLSEAQKVFRQSRALPELDLTTVVARKLLEAREVS